jgi:hypothetical protein
MVERRYKIEEFEESYKDATSFIGSIEDSNNLQDFVNRINKKEEKRDIESSEEST